VLASDRGCDRARAGSNWLPPLPLDPTLDDRCQTIRARETGRAQSVCKACRPRRHVLLVDGSPVFHFFLSTLEQAKLERVGKVATSRTGKERTGHRPSSPSAKHFRPWSPHRTPQDNWKLEARSGQGLNHRPVAQFLCPMKQPEAVTVGSNCGLPPHSSKEYSSLRAMKHRVGCFSFMYCVNATGDWMPAAAVKAMEARQRGDQSEAGLSSKSPAALRRFRHRRRGRAHSPRRPGSVVASAGPCLTWPFA
jgi:hypothetical protein